MRALTIVLFLSIMAEAEAQAPAPVADPSGVIGAIRREPAAPPEPTPRLKDGTVNLGRSRGEKGIWGLPVIANFASVAAGVAKDFRGNLRNGAPADGWPASCCWPTRATPKATS